jgi:pyruvate formate lyase activating enzyme
MYKLAQLSPTPLNTLTAARDIAINMGLKYVYIGNVPGLDFENTVCPKCKKVVIERRGFSIIRNDIINGKCINCGSEINGFWK